MTVSRELWRTKSGKLSSGSRPWSRADDAILRENAGRIGSAEIALLVGRSNNAVRHRAENLGISFRIRKSLAEEMIEEGMDPDEAQRAEACERHLEDLIRVYGNPRRAKPAADVVRHVIQPPVSAPITSYGALCVEA